MLLRTLLASPRLVAGGALSLLFVVFAMSGGTLVSAEPVVLAAGTATPAPPAATTTPVPCVTQPVGVQVIVENPAPGAVLQSGQQVVMQGVAFDSGATTGPGIASVSAYLGNRDSGGIFLGNAELGQPNPLASSGSQFANAGWTVRTISLPSGNGGRTIYVYAESLAGNAEGVATVPIFLNAAPTAVKGQVPTAVLPPPPACTPTPTPTAVPAAAPAAAPAAPAATATPTTAALPTPTPFNLTAPLAPAPAAAAPAPAAAESAPAAAAPPAPVAVAPATATTAPRGGGIPSELGLLLVGAGALVIAGGAALRRRERTTPRK